MKLIIDPGHGGKDSGGGSNKLWLEKDKVLEISLYQYYRFQELGVDVKITRYEDKYIGPDERASIVRSSGADICISNHINNSSSGKGEGAETIHSIHSDGKLATLILEELVKEGAIYRHVFSKANSRGQDWYYMHRETGSVQTIIVEYGFSCNEEDTKKIQENWQEYAEAVIRAVCMYADITYKVPVEKGKENQEIIENELKEIKINLHDKALSVKGIFLNNTNYIPVRFLEQLGYKINWNNGVVEIDYKK